MVAARLPVLFFTPTFGSRIAGLYMLTQQSISLPMQIVAGGIGDVFRQHASRDFTLNGNCRAIYIRTLKTLITISVLPFLIIAIIAPDLFSIVFGEEWRSAGGYARILSPMYFFQFISSPLSSMFMIAEKQRADIAWQICLLASTLASLATGWVVQSVHVSIAMFSATYSIMYLVNVYMTYRFSGG